ncbi:MAG: class I SAM-dependent methyltransferase [Chlorobia bacterium]|nr:class I SAM-dependent methyltransferase [Fimbriimonadaceae bacterium]
METATNTSAFVGNVPENYDQYMGPMFFRPYAVDIAERVARHSPSSILETAAGTGVSTEALERANPNADIIATDLNADMLERAKSVRPNLSVTWSVADALELPYEDNRFDVVVTQYGVMFFPDKPAAFREAFRVLKPGGAYIFNVWDSLEGNDVGRTTQEVVTKMIPVDTPTFLQTPFGWSDPTPFIEAGKAAGFETSMPVAVEKQCESVSALAASKGLMTGSPMYGQIVGMGVDPGPLQEEIARLLAERYGSEPMVAKMRAWVYEFKKPG